MVCATLTGKIFSAGAISTQRGEGINSMVKQRGEKKKELKNKIFTS